MSASWIGPALLASVLWGIVGILQKLGANRVNAASLLIWVTVGYVVALPGFFLLAPMSGLTAGEIGLGILAGAVNGLGTWFLFASLERGAKASVAIPLTALYPLVTVLMALVFLNERLSAREWLGVALAIAGGVLLSYEPQPSPESSIPEVNVKGVVNE